jgi:GDP-4-dehydro-6-deoxy-D-mannose reductase
VRRILITGAGGFVGRYATATFAAHGYEVIRAGHGSEPLDIGLDLSDASNVQAVVDLARASHVLHLAAQSFVPTAAADPLRTYDINVMGTARLLQALHRCGERVRVLIVSSAEVYGQRTPEEFPLREELPLAPRNPYAASKAAAEPIALVANGPQIAVIIARAFNHIGPGQRPCFVVAGFAAQLAAMLRGGERVLRVGNLEAERDFLDVRDVVRAYVSLMESGRGGEAYNVCSGVPVAIKEILRRMIALADLPVEVRQDPKRLRPSDVPRFFGEAEKLRRETGWFPRYSLGASLSAILESVQEGTDGRGRNLSL